MRAIVRLRAAAARLPARRWHRTEVVRRRRRLWISEACAEVISTGVVAIWPARTDAEQSRSSMSSPRAFAFLAGWGLLYAGYTGNVQHLMIYFGDWVHFGSVPGYMSLFLLSLWDVLWPPQSFSSSLSCSPSPSFSNE